MTATKSNHITGFFNVAEKRLTSRLEGDLPHPRVVGTTTIKLASLLFQANRSKNSFPSVRRRRHYYHYTVTSHANQADKHQQYNELRPAANI